MNQPYRAIIVDDEPPARDIIEIFVSRTPGLLCQATCSNAMQALDAIRQLKPDLLFLDIQMPEMTGMELMNLQLAHRPDIILTTAYPEYALKSYDFAVIDYLVKPIAFERFVQAINKFKDKRGAPLSTGPVAVDEYNPVVTTEGNPNQMSPSAVWLREEKRLLQIPYDDIYYVEGLKDYAKVYLRDQMIVTHLSIGQAEELLPPPAFIRIHRSHLVRRSAIRVIDGNTLVLTNGKQLNIGPFYREELKKYISALQ